MSSSTIMIKSPSPNYQDIRHLQEYKFPTLLVFSLWTFSSMFSAAKIEFSSNVTGISVAFNMQDVVLIAFASWMLHRGLATRNIALIFPWVIVTFYGLYYNHYKSVSKMATILRHIRYVTAVPWLALFAISIGLVLRVILTLRILQLSANLWYRKKLEKELYETVL
ncbi:unnamed protein product [Acanthoscelides obtectus]|uniref:Uncharacterized protein n=1 Tax=Acanthoscelides obtectus TaxID=200917 RepID=A0A9P0KMW4_ACAOB|nr:unnamed protein product [Acanthoscelides obtectus]CAK1644683.1 hypothetical protein AOBTE_LOCUS13920 [Acanthoscelides obtectus]